MASVVAIIACVLLLRKCHDVSAFSSLSTRNVLLVTQQQLRRTRRHQPILHGSFFDDLFGGGSEKDTDKDDASPKEAISNQDGDNDDENSLWDASGLQAEIERRNASESSSSAPPARATSMAAVEKDGDKEETEEVEFDGYMFRDAIYNKFGVCWDVDFQRVESYGFKKLYLNVMPFRLGSRRFRHETEHDYLCHLQAVVEILEKYDLLYSVLAQLEETNKKPRPGTSPLVAVPLRLDLSPEQLDEILGPAR